MSYLNNTSQIPAVGHCAVELVKYFMKIPLDRGKDSEKERVR